MGGGGRAVKEEAKGAGPAAAAVEPNARDGAGRTPLHLACKQVGSRAEQPPSTPRADRLVMIGRMGNWARQTS